MSESILDQVRREAVRDYRGQLSMVSYDEGYRRGELDGRRNGHISEGRWFCFGVMFGIVLSTLVSAF